MTSEWQVAKVRPRRPGSAEARSVPITRSVAPKKDKEICEHFLGGFCAFGDKCYKLHDGQARQANTSASQTLKYPPIVARSDPRYKTQICVFNETGTCGRGQECSFAHSRDEMRHYVNQQRYGMTNTAEAATAAAKRPTRPAPSSAHPLPNAGFTKAAAPEAPVSTSSKALPVVLQEKFEDTDPMCCPVTQEIMQTPIICSDGFSYEKSAIMEWISRSDRSPMTNEPLEKDIMIPNHTLRALIAHTLRAK